MSHGRNTELGADAKIHMPKMRGFFFSGSYNCHRCCPATRAFIHTLSAPTNAPTLPAGWLPNNPLNPFRAGAPCCGGGGSRTAAAPHSARSARPRRAAAAAASLSELTRRRCCRQLERAYTRVKLFQAVSAFPLSPCRMEGQKAT